MNTPKVVRGDALNIGQLSSVWKRPPAFVRDLIDRGLLMTDERGWVSNSELARFYRESGELIDGASDEAL